MAKVVIAIACLQIANLCVKVLAARDLIAADWNGLSDPFLIIQYDNIQHKGKVHKKTLDPKFNETCKLFVSFVRCASVRL
jgi:Ca2+-dependent lipid-binding protein